MDTALQKMRDRVLAGQDISGWLGIEIGPLCRPLIRKDESSVHYVDHCSTEELKCKYSGDPNVSQNEIVDVDFVWKDRPLRDTLGLLCPLDYIVASHVIEHVPDLIGWLEEMHDSLREGGLLILIVPDKRFTFDVHRRTSSFDEVQDAYSEKRRRPGLRCVMDHFANVVAADCHALWNNYETAKNLPFCHVPAYLELARSSTPRAAISMFTAGFLPPGFSWRRWDELLKWPRLDSISSIFELPHLTTWSFMSV